ncbi:nucleotidyltransferase domain-containing protein [Marispirochaeta sp.]|uniref:nucleotidyltransferase domain-containing protein n=1 Tax=Marispirochaeta sp. TaxID=2038653 RepID=UPI0029C95617|nr:hypothetical protein [Marispirochaeta sp.]
MNANQNSIQLKIIEEFMYLCSEKSIGIWLLGGWGIDFLHGKQTRNHSDIDFILDRKNYFSLYEVIVDYADAINLYTEQKAKFIKNGVSCEFCFFLTIEDDFYIDLDEKDPLVYPMPWNSFPEKYNGFLSGIQVRTISWEAQYVAKQGCFYYSKQPLRKKDESDLCIIADNLTIPQIKLDNLLPGIKKTRLGLRPPQERNCVKE